MTTLLEINKRIISEAKENGSQGLTTLRQAISQGYFDIYFTWVTKNRLQAYIISPDPTRSELLKLVIPEAGYRLYANWKDGYHVFGGGYSKPDHVVDAMVWAIVNRVTIGNTQAQALEHFNQLREYIKAVLLD